MAIGHAGTSPANRVVVTGAAGFLGSHLVDHLLAGGLRVIGVDALTPAYDRRIKEANLADAAGHPRFRFVEADLRTADLGGIVSGADLIVHLAGEPGIAGSWGPGFADHAGNNLVAAQRVLDAAVAGGVRRIALGSSAAVYGDARTRPFTEEDRPRPISPHGVTVLAAEALLEAYAQHGLSTVALRYSSSYGPRQRPGMAVQRLLASAATGAPVPVYGGGGQLRDIAYVADVVAMTAAIAMGDLEGPVNVGAGECFTLDELLDAVSRVTGATPVVQRRPALAGAPHRVRIGIERAVAATGLRPATDLMEGVRAQWTAMGGVAPAGAAA